MAALRERFEATLRLGSEGAEGYAGLYTGTLLGERSALSEEQEQLFARTGTAHLFAVSGLHVGLVALVMGALLRTVLRLPEAVAAVLGLAAVFLYAQVTGATPSGMRAFAMVAFFWAAVAVGRQSGAWNALLASAAVVLVLDPAQLGMTGFRLSYFIVAGILLYGLPLWRTLREHTDWTRYIPEPDIGPVPRFGRWVFRGTLAAASVSLAAMLYGTPLLLEAFGLASPGGVLVNIGVGLAALFIVTTGVLSLLGGLVGLTEVSAFLNHAAWVLYAGIEKSLAAAVQVPGMYVTGEPRSAAWSAAAMGALLICGMVTANGWGRARTVAFCAAPLIVLILLTVGSVPAG